MARGALNPFSGRVNLEYELAGPPHVRVSLVNVLGQEVAELVNARQATGQHRVDSDAGAAGAGAAGAGSLP